MCACLCVFVCVCVCLCVHVYIARHWRLLIWVYWLIHPPLLTLLALRVQKHKYWRRSCCRKLKSRNFLNSSQGYSHYEHSRTIFCLFFDLCAATHNTFCFSVVTEFLMEGRRASDSVSSSLWLGFFRGRKAIEKGNKNIRNEHPFSLLKSRLLEASSLFLHAYVHKNS